MPVYNAKALTVEGQEFSSLSKACNYYDIGYRDLAKYATRHDISKEEALERMAAEKKQIHQLMFSTAAK